MEGEKPPTDKELLRLAGKMHLAAEQVLISDARNLSDEWAQKKAAAFRVEICDCPENAGRKRNGRGGYRRFYCAGCLAAALDEAMERGAQRERWECHKTSERCKFERASQASSMSELGNVEAVCAKASEAARIAEAIAARGPMLAPVWRIAVRQRPMLGPEEEKRG